MTGTMLQQPTATQAFAGLNIGIGNQLSPSLLNSYRINAVAERLSSHVQPGYRGDSVEFFNLCLSLARGIDYSISNNEVPRKAQDLPVLLKQICQRKNDAFLQAAIMVLIISVKNACKVGWFKKKETEELFTIANEIVKSYYSMGDVNAGHSYCNTTISIIMQRFYPRLKMGQILASLKVNPGFGAFAVDFQISKNTLHSPQDKIRLLVAQTDNIETSACIISPQQANFLLNGKGVDRRTNVLMDTGPQLPTVVTNMLKYGTNLLQAVGQFNGHYVIVVAFMGVTTSPVNPVLPVYVQPAVTSVDSDSDIIEGPSRISLNCPISFSRIKTPVKGRSCKHLQCFDFDNFIDINSRRPSWRCPHCNQYVCYTDICLDRNMVEVLKDVGDNVMEVIIRADGSWKAVLENDQNVDKTQNKVLDYENEHVEQEEPTCSPSAVPDVLDLTNDDDQMEIINVNETEDRKPRQVDLRQSDVVNSTSLSVNSAGVNQNVAAQVEDDFWPGIYLTHSSSDTPRIGGILEHPVLTRAFSPVFNQEAQGHGNALATNSAMQNQLSVPNNLPPQQLSYVNSAVNEYGRSAPIPRHAVRDPTVLEALQALPVQSPITGPQQRSRTSFNSVLPSSSSVTPVSFSNPATVDGLNAILSDTERQQLFSRPSMSLPQVSGVASSALQNQSTQIRVSQNVNGSAPSQLPNSYRSGLLTELRNPHLQQALNPRTSQPVVQSSSNTRAHTNPQRSHVLQGGIGRAAGTNASSQQARVMAAARHHPSIGTPVQTQTSRTGTSFPANSFRGLAAEQRRDENIGGTTPESVSRSGNNLFDSQAAGRMRGSLLGRSCPAGVEQLIIGPTQPVQNTRPQGSPQLQPPTGDSLSPQIQALIANNKNAHDPTQNT
ncbi:hypothetical protein L6164_019411 [Bauhinia variegata]|uniref:Uncharacterized protein n=1 Tax=Bauhinia variegata TaxID=167791 RepID=A0ACB9MRV2_BAUVA|nr:hypothetical protein L6164_019411 [Bauhinia variegata]